jgi:hypothetical protein
MLKIGSDFKQLPSPRQSKTFFSTMTLNRTFSPFLIL